MPEPSWTCHVWLCLKLFEPVWISKRGMSVSGFAFSYRHLWFSLILSKICLPLQRRDTGDEWLVVVRGGRLQFFSLPIWVSLSLQGWALSVFLKFFNNKKWFVVFFIKLIWLGVGFLNRTGAKIGYKLYKNAKK